MKWLVVHPVVCVCDYNVCLSKWRYFCCAEYLWAKYSVCWHISWCCDCGCMRNSCVKNGCLCHSLCVRGDRDWLQYNYKCLCVGGDRYLYLISFDTLNNEYSWEDSTLRGSWWRNESHKRGFCFDTLFGSFLPSSFQALLNSFYLLFGHGLLVL